MSFPKQRTISTKDNQERQALTGSMIEERFQVRRWFFGAEINDVRRNDPQEIMILRSVASPNRIGENRNLVDRGIECIIHNGDRKNIIHRWNRWIRLRWDRLVRRRHHPETKAPCRCRVNEVMTCFVDRQEDGLGRRSVGHRKVEQHRHGRTRSGCREGGCCNQQ